MLCARFAHTTYSHFCPLKRLFSAESKISTCVVALRNDYNMKHTSRYVIMVMLGVLLLLPTLVCGIGEKPDLAATVQAAVAATQGAQATETSFVQPSRQPYDLILPESPLKGNSPGPSEYVLGTSHLVLCQG
jgi:hypothetical protein